MNLPQPVTPAQQQEKMRRVVSQISGLPTLPVMLSNINRLMLNPRTSAKEVSQLITSDPVLTSKILRVVNSSFYGFPSRITTVTHAIVILGFNTIKSIILSSTIFDVFKGSDPHKHFNMEEFWRHSIACGAAAKIIAKNANYPAIEEFFIAGLLHDIGKVVISQYFKNDFNQIVEIVSSRDVLILKAEGEVLGVTHAELGAWLFEKWNLSKNLVDGTAKHHNPALATEGQKYASVVHVADILARSIMIGNPGDKKIPAIHAAAWKTLGFNPDMLPRLLSETDQEVEKAFIFLDIAK